jgi:membrane protein YdbS with pleckstrin-like domain
MQKIPYVGYNGNMIVEDRPYRMGYRALIYMILGKLKYPVLLGLLMAVLGLLVWLGLDTIAVVEKYGIVFTVLLAVFLSLSVVPEYLGFSVMIGEDAVYVRSGILSHRVVAAPYAEIQVIEDIVVPRGKLLGLAGIAVVSGKGKHETRTIIPLLSGTFRAEFREVLIERAERA